MSPNQESAAKHQEPVEIAQSVGLAERKPELLSSMAEKMPLSTGD